MNVPATDPGWEFDHVDPSLAPHMNEVFAAFRERCPVTRTGRHGGYWAVLSYGAVREAFGDPARFSSASGVIFPSVVVAGTPQPPLEADPPDHAIYRKMIQKYFTRPAVARYEEVFRDLAARRISELVSAGKADLLADLAGYLPPIGIAMILGLPAQDGLRFVTWTQQMFGALTAGDHATLAGLNDMFTAYLGEQVQRQRDAGADTVMTAIAGQAISAAGRIALVISSANRDPAVFGHPDEFICPRQDNPHLSFGHGVHRCAGEHLAKLQMKIVAEEVLRLMPGYRLADGYQADWQVHGMMRGLASLPAIMTA
jgi:cytochrome P450